MPIHLVLSSVSLQDTKAFLNGNTIKYIYKHLKVGSGYLSGHGSRRTLAICPGGSRDADNF